MEIQISEGQQQCTKVLSIITRQNDQQTLQLAVVILKQSYESLCLMFRIMLGHSNATFGI